MTQQITLTFPDNFKKTCFLEMLPIFKKEGEAYTVDFEQLELMKHKSEKYKVDTNNSELRKLTAGEKAAILQGQGKNLKSIAEALTNDLTMKTSRGNQKFYSETVKRLIEEYYRNKK